MPLLLFPRPEADIVPVAAVFPKIPLIFSIASAHRQASGTSLAYPLSNWGLFGRVRVHLRGPCAS